jgi:hypothetical protein
MEAIGPFWTTSQAVGLNGRSNGKEVFGQTEWEPGAFMVKAPGWGRRGILGINIPPFDFRFTELLLLR